MHRERNSQIKKRKQNAYKHYLTMIISGINKYIATVELCFKTQKDLKIFWSSVGLFVAVSFRSEFVRDFSVVGHVRTKIGLVSPGSVDSWLLVNVILLYLIPIFNSTGGYMFKTNHLAYEFLIVITSFLLLDSWTAPKKFLAWKTFLLLNLHFDIFLRMRFLYILFCIVHNAICENSECLYQKLNDENWQKICPTQKILSVCEGPSLLKIIA